jgi:cysteine-rich repeat protein
VSTASAHCRRTRPARLALLIAVLCLAGCGGGDSEQTFATCGNGTLDSGERCDDSNLDDSDDCTSACRPAACGDGVIQVGVEQCDGFLPSVITCQSLGLGGDASPVCSAGCAFDVSACGPPLTPTPIPPTATITPTVTPTIPPTATPTEDAAACGDGLLAANETCAICAADCTPQACTPSGATATFAIALQGPHGSAIDQADITLAYRTNVTSLPGTGGDRNVLRRLRPVPQPAPPPRLVQVSDADYAVTVIAVRTEGLSGPIFTAMFDTCAGAPAPALTDFSCTCAATIQCTCSVEPAS